MSKVANYLYKIFIVCGILLVLIGIFGLFFYIAPDLKESDNFSSKNDTSESSQLKNSESEDDVSNKIDNFKPTDSNVVSHNPSINTNSQITNSSDYSSQQTSSTNSYENDKTPPEKVTKVFSFECDFSMPECEKDTFYDSKNGNYLPYTLFLPKNYDPTKKYPVILFLHGAGEMGNDNEKHLNNMRNMFEYNYDLVSQAIVICPQSNEWWNLDREYTGDQKGTLGSALHLLEEIQGNYSCDSNRIYVTGLSMGGYATWELLEEYGDIFAAGIPVCGGGNPEKAYKLKDIPIRIYHSRDDGTVSFSASQRMYNAIINAGGEKVTFIRLNGLGHNSWNYAYSDRDGFCWLFAQNKASNPTCKYEYIPFFKIVDAKGNTVIWDKDIDVIYYGGSYEDKYIITVDLALYENAVTNLRNAYTSSDTKEFTAYWLSEKLYTFTVDGPPINRIFSIVDVFDDKSVLTFYRTVKKSSEILNGKIK